MMLGTSSSISYAYHCRLSAFDPVDAPDLPSTSVPVAVNGCLTEAVPSLGLIDSDNSSPTLQPRLPAGNEHRPIRHLGDIHHPDSPKEPRQAKLRSPEAVHGPLEGELRSPEGLRDLRLSEIHSPDCLRDPTEGEPYSPESLGESR